MKRFIFITTILFSFCLTSFSQKDTKAKEVLDQAATAFEKAGDITADFIMSIKESGPNHTESFEGKIDLKGNKFHFDVPDMECWFDGKTQWVLQKEWEEVNISEPSKEEVQVLNPGIILKMYKKGFNYRYVGEKTAKNGKKVQEVELTPEQSGTDISRLTLQIDMQNKMPVKIQIGFSNGLENIIHIEKYHTNLSLSDTHFVFNKAKHPDAEIIDLR